MCMWYLCYKQQSVKYYIYIYIYLYINKIKIDVTFFVFNKYKLCKIICQYINICFFQMFILKNAIYYTCIYMYDNVMGMTLENIQILFYDGLHHMTLGLLYKNIIYYVVVLAELLEDLRTYKVSVISQLVIKNSIYSLQSILDRIMYC